MAKLLKYWGVIFLIAFPVFVAISFSFEAAFLYKALFVFVSIVLVATQKVESIRKWTNYTLFLSLTVIFLTEMLLRAVPSLWPVHLMQYMEDTSRKEAARQLGLFTDMKGNGLLYYYPPHHKVQSDQSIKIDKEGFRNSTDWSISPDVVVLGDSITIAFGAAKDIGELLRDNDLDTINLSMGGYGPQQYRDVFIDKIINKQIKPKLVVVSIFAGNDFRDALGYSKFKLDGKDYRSYLGEASSPIPFRKNALQIERLFLGWKHYLDWKRREEPNLKEVKLPYKSFKFMHTWPIPLVSATDKEYMETIGAIGDINKESRKIGAKVLLSVMPSPGNIYSAFCDCFREDDANYSMLISLLKDFSESNDIILVDLLPELRAKIKNQFLFLNDSDTHFNSHGVEVMRDTLYPAIKNTLESHKK